MSHSVAYLWYAYYIIISYKICTTEVVGEKFIHFESSELDFYSRNKIIRNGKFNEYKQNLYNIILQICMWVPDLLGMLTC